VDTESRVDEQLSILTARLRILEVREATRECIARDGFTADLGMVDAYADNYAPDGVSETALEGRGNIVGRDALRTFITSPSNPGSQHLGINMLIHVDGDTAWAEGYSVTTLRQPDDSFKIHLAGYNHWDFARVDGAWKITRRRRCTIGDVNHGGPWGGTIITRSSEDAEIAGIAMRRVGTPRRRWRRTGYQLQGGIGPPPGPEERRLEHVEVRTRDSAVAIVVDTDEIELTAVH